MRRSKTTATRLAATPVFFSKTSDVLPLPLFQNKFSLLFTTYSRGNSPRPIAPHLQPGDVCFQRQASLIVVRINLAAGATMNCVWKREGEKEEDKGMSKFSPANNHFGACCCARHPENTTCPLQPAPRACRSSLVGIAAKTTLFASLPS